MSNVAKGRVRSAYGSAPLETKEKKVQPAIDVEVYARRLDAVFQDTYLYKDVETYRQGDAIMTQVNFHNKTDASKGMSVVFWKELK